jgi:hypothetical protein
MKVPNTAAHLRRPNMVRKNSRCLALASLLALLLLLPTAALQAGERAPAVQRVPAVPAETATSPRSLLESLWQAVAAAACAHGIPISPEGTCVAPGILTACEKGPLIDPNGRCTN